MLFAYIVLIAVGVGAALAILLPSLMSIALFVLGGTDAVRTGWTFGIDHVRGGRLAVLVAAVIGILLSGALGAWLWSRLVVSTGLADVSRNRLGKKS